MRSAPHLNCLSSCINSQIKCRVFADLSSRTPVIGARHDTHTLRILLAILLARGAVYAQIYRLAEMNADQVHALDHEKTVILIPGGILPGPSALKSIAGKPSGKALESLQRGVPAQIQEVHFDMVGC